METYYEIIQMLGYQIWIFKVAFKFFLRAVHIRLKRKIKRLSMYPLASTQAGGSHGKEFTCNVGDPSSIPVLGRSPGEGNDNPFQYSCLENPMNRGAWQATVHGVPKSWT